MCAHQWDMILGQKTQVCPKNRNGYSTHFGGECFWEGERSLGLGGALHAVAQGAHALLPVAREPSPLDLPHGRVAQVGHVCPDCSDSFEMQWTKLGFIPWHREALLLCQGPNAAGPWVPLKPRKFQMGPPGSTCRVLICMLYSENHIKGINCVKKL